MWLSSLFGKRPSASRSRRAALVCRRGTAFHQPRLEALEDRCLLSAGLLDPTFGTGGQVSTAVGANGSLANALAIQPDGKIVAVGMSNNSSKGYFYQDFSLARYNPNGSLDSAFGSGGAVITRVASGNDRANAVVLQPDGKILLGGTANLDSSIWIDKANYAFALARYNANGTLDTSFGTGGKILSSSLPGITALGLDAAGDIFTLPTLAEFSPSGQADAAVTPAAITASSHGGTSAFLPTGQFVQANSFNVATHDVDVQVQRFNAGGGIASTSPAFDYSGAAGLDQARDFAGAVALQANGQAVVGGSHFLSSSVFGLARVNPDGTLDASFGSGGVLTTTFNGAQGVGAVVIQPDGKIIAVGFSENNSTGHVFIALARYNP
jgi:uncharacterized delta-60 repeat protein